MSKMVNKFILHCSLLPTEHPVLCFSSLFLLLVYLFLPSFFYFFVVIAVAAKFAIHHTHCDKNIKHEEQVSTQTAPDVRNKSFNRAHSVRRRKEQQNKVEEAKDIMEDNPKDIREVKVDDYADNHRIERVVKNENGKKGTFRGRYHDGRSSDEDQEEENKALEWTEDDQKNLTDLGLSEIERNKRLESLIAKRMARKLLSIQVRKTLMNMGNSNHHHHHHGHGSPHLASILIPKASSNPQISPIPGSAPSVLLPNRSPFDLPYDSHEEKPNLLTGDGLPKDLMFCRHVSFSQGVHFPCPEEFDNDRPAPFNSIRSIPELSRLRNEPENRRNPNLVTCSPKKASSRTPRANKNERKGDGEGFFYTNKRVIHRSRDSIDSDMHVEMTESASHLDLASLGIEDELDNGKPWAASSHLAGVEENESRSREVHEVSEKDVIAVGFARLNPICDDHVLSDEIGLVVEPPQDGSHSTHSNDLEEKTGEQEQERSSSSTPEKNIMNDVHANNNDEDILDFIKQTYGEEGSNGQRSSSPSNVNQMIVAPNDESRSNAAPIDENCNYGPNPFVGLSSLIVHRNVDDSNSQQPITESKEQQETVIEGGPSDSSSSSTPKSSSTIKGENTQFDVNEVHSETVGSSDGGEEQFGVGRVSLNIEPIPFAGPSNEVQETDTGPPLGSSSPSPKSVLQKKFSMASISSSDQINMEVPQPEQPNEDVISVSAASQHDNIQTINDPSTYIEMISKSAADPESIIIGLTQNETGSGSTNEREGSHNADKEHVESEHGREGEGDNKTADEERNLEATVSVQVNDHR